MEITVENPYGFIYITTNNINGMCYIGKCVFNNTSRWKSYLGSGKYLKRAIKKYGKENFFKTIVCFAYSNEELNQLETQYIILHNAVKSLDYYNIASGGEGGISNFANKTSEEMIEINKKISESRIGTHHSEETKRKMCELNIGENNPFYGKHHNEESKKKISKNKKGKNTGADNPTSRAVKLINTGEIFYTIEACKKYGISQSNITRCCQGKRKSAGKDPITGEKLIWVYYEVLKKNSKEIE